MTFPRLTKRTVPAAACAVLILTLSACGSGKPAQTFNGPVYDVELGQVSGLGKILVDGQGYTLYMFVPDHQSGKSTCYGPCSVEWSPLTIPTGKSPVAGSGTITSKLSTTHRTDGTVQVVYNGWPLYTWAQDNAPGQATGEGLDNLGGLWWVLDSSGVPIEKRGSGSI